MALTDPMHVSVSTPEPVATRDPCAGPGRVVVLYSRLSGYMAACLRKLKEVHGTELMVIRYRPASEAPFDADLFVWIDHLHDREDLDRGQMQELVTSFDPDVLFMSGWLDSDYLEIARTMKRRGTPVIAGSDAQWTGSARQQLARIAAPWYLHRSIDVLWVAGERQQILAEKLGFTGGKCWTGVYACDWDSFGSSGPDRVAPADPFFLFVGRYVHAKGLDVLAEAYTIYRRSVEHAWPLVCVGAGEKGYMIREREGIEDRGFIQPADLPGLMRTASAFILPSRKEAWGVVLQEAAASALPLICSDACGAGVHLVRDGYNGYNVQTGDADHLAEAMVRLARLPASERSAMGRRSHELSRQYTPETWIDTFVSGLKTFCTAS